MELLHTLVLIIHVFGACIIVGCAVFAILVMVHKQLVETAGAFMPVIGKLAQKAAIVQLVTGIYLYMSERDEIRPNRLFWIKLTLFVIDGFVAGYLIQRESKQKNFKKLKVILWLHLILIFAIVALGVGVVETPTK